MRTSTRLSLAALFSLSLTSISSADEPVVPLPRPVFAGGLAAPGGGYYGPVRFGAATTAHESINRGRADLLRAQGENALLNAEAARSREEAKSRFLDNEVKRLAVRHERKRLGIAERAHHYEHLQSKRETQMALNRAARAAQDALPEAALIETNAQTQLRLAKQLLQDGQVDSGVAQLQLITEQFSQTGAAREAASLLDGYRG